jgi:hypothetical protein
MSNIPPSPVTLAFSGIQWDPMTKLRLTNAEKQLLRNAEANPIDYTLNTTPAESVAYIKVVLKVLAEASGASGPSSKVSHVKEMLSEDEALQLLYTDPMGVVTHYAITKLYDIIVCLREKKRGSVVTMGTTFFNPQDRNLIDEWRPLLRVLHLGGSGDAFAQREFLHLRIYMLSFDFMMHSICLDLMHCSIYWLLLQNTQLMIFIFRWCCILSCIHPHGRMPLATLCHQ